MNDKTRLIVTPGEPAGIGPDLCINLSQLELPFEWVVVADPVLITARARQLNVPVQLTAFDPSQPPRRNAPGEIKILAVKLANQASAGELDPENARYVLETIKQAVQYCQQNTDAALVTGPVHKGIINQAGFPFTGHTEYIAELTQSPLPVMMLLTPGLRVALVTTHLPLHQVSQSITPSLLEQVIKVLYRDLVSCFNITDPVIYVCGLNPHAGENGHLGTEELETIIPVIEKLKSQQIKLVGPLPADTIFSPGNLEHADVVLAMYHDQGLPVLKYKGFGEAVNVTLGLPIVRTSVDHGTALELAGTGRINTGSMQLAMQTAIDMLDNMQPRS